MKHKLIAILVFMLSCSSIGATVKRWTLNECMRYAVEHSPKTNKQKSQNKIYHQDYLEAIGRLLPNISAGTSANFNFGRAVNSDNIYADINSFSNNYDISGSLTLFDGLANINRLKMTKVGKLMGKKELEEAVDRVAYDTMEAFINVLYNMDMAALAKQQLEESEKSTQQVQRMYELGVKGFPDLAEMEAKEAADLYNVTRRNNMLTLAIIILKEKMNYPIEENLIIAEEEMVQVVLRVDEGALEIYEKSKAYNPKAQVAMNSYEIQKLNYKMSKGNLMPSISVRGGISTNFFRLTDGSDYTSFKSQFKNKRGEFVGFTLSIPIFSGFSRTASVQRSKARMYMAETDRDDVLRKLYSEIEQAVTDTNGQVDEYKQAVKQKQSVNVAHQVNLKKYNEGLIDPIILHTSANRLLQAKAEELNAKFKYHLKYKLVNYYKGESFLTMD